MLLFQASAGDSVTSMVLNEMRKHAPILEHLQYFKAPGSGASEVRYGDNINGTLGTRSIDEDFGVEKVAPTYGQFALKILGRNVRIDTAYEERGGDVPSEFQVKLRNWAENAGRSLMGYLLNGDASTNAEEFNGLRTIIADLVTAGDDTRVITPATNGMILPLGNDNSARSAQQKFFEQLDKLIEAVDGGANCLLMDGWLLNRISAVAKEQCVISLNEYDARVDTYNGIPIVPTGRKYDGTRIIPHTETVGTSTDCTSVFAIRSAEKAHLTAMTTQVGLKVYPMQKVSNYYEHSVQFQMDMAALSQRCVAQLEGIRLG